MLVLCRQIKNVIFSLPLSHCSLRKVAASLTTPPFLSLSARRSSSSSFSTSTVSFERRRAENKSRATRIKLPNSLHPLHLVYVLNFPFQKSLTRKCSSGRTARQTSSSTSSSGTEFTCRAFTYGRSSSLKIKTQL